MRAIFEQDHEDFRAAVRSYVDRHVQPAYEKAVQERLIPRELWLEAGSMGLLAINVPEAWGGSGAEADYRFATVIGEELARVSMGMASSFGIHYDVVAPYIVDLATEAQRERWLPGFCTGEVKTAIAMTEPSGGSDLAHLKTTARELPGGGWVMNGSKTFITNGATAELVIVAARTEPEEKGARGVSLFLVDSSLPGFRHGRKLDKVGQPESDTAELFFDDLELPADALLGERGQGFIAMMERLPQERIGAAISNLAHARGVLEDTIAYAKERQAFGSPIGSFQSLKFLLAEMVTKVDVTQAFLDQCVMEHSAGALDAVTAAKAKWWAADVQNDVLDGCVQIFGGYGYMNEYRVARAWSDARVTKIWAGSNEIMKELIGRSLGF